MYAEFTAHWCFMMRPPIMDRPVYALIKMKPEKERAMALGADAGIGKKAYELTIDLGSNQIWY